MKVSYYLMLVNVKKENNMAIIKALFTLMIQG